MSLHVGVDDQEPEELPTNLPLKRVNAQKMQNAITSTMEKARKQNFVVGWASSVSPSDGGEPAEDAGGHAKFEEAGIAAIEMTPHTRQTIGSCSKTITAVAALVAEWAIGTRFGQKKHPDIAAHQRKILDRKLFEFLPLEWDRSTINGQGRYSPRLYNPLAGAGVGAPQTTVITFKHVLQHRAYLLETVTSRYHSPTGVGDGGYYVNLKEAVRIGPVLKRPPNNVIGKGRGQYSNSGYGLFRLVIPYLLGSDPSLIASGPLDGYPSTNDFNSGPKSQREVLTAVYYFLFVRDHVLKPCGVTKASVFPNDNLCYYNTDGWGTDEFQYCDRDSHLLTCGEGGWHMSAHDLRKFLVGVQQGKPFGGDTSWWWDVMRKHQLGMDPTWLTSAAPKKSRIVLQNGNIVNLFRKSGGSGFRFHSGDGVEARAAAEWIITDDGTTAAIVMNSGSKSHIGVPSLLTVLKDAYKTAADAIERTPARPTRLS